MDLADPPTEEEVFEAIGKLKGGKVGGINGIVPEMVKSCGGEIMDYIVECFTPYGENRQHEKNGELSCLWIFPRKVTSLNVKNGMKSACWM